MGVDHQILAIPTGVLFLPFGYTHRMAINIICENVGRWLVEN